MQKTVTGLLALAASIQAIQATTTYYSNDLVDTTACTNVTLGEIVLNKDVIIYYMKGSDDDIATCAQASTNLVVENDTDRLACINTADQTVNSGVNAICPMAALTPHCTAKTFCENGYPCYMKENAYPKSYCPSQVPSPNETTAIFITLESAIQDTAVTYGPPAFFAAVETADKDVVDCVSINYITDYQLNKAQSKKLFVYSVSDACTDAKREQWTKALRKGMDQWQVDHPEYQPPFDVSVTTDIKPISDYGGLNNCFRYNWTEDSYSPSSSPLSKYYCIAEEYSCKFLCAWGTDCRANSGKPMNEWCGSGRCNKNPDPNGPDRICSASIVASTIVPVLGAAIAAAMMFF
jgi:hypothetical protein